ncbi:hypothetical protein DEO72_LG8g1985 [Vigna unguiculata]|uniref:Uncharacterized protein n=1 Tax=Vigna unguiculata TaxID=3917 RepID=A0A4D6MRA9_VIGUN|nr:hypothetical protein DEO72_LG8g1985 [Vigna unguiculata]
MLAEAWVADVLYVQDGGVVGAGASLNASEMKNGTAVVELASLVCARVMLLRCCRMTMMLINGVEYGMEDAGAMETRSSGGGTIVVMAAVTVQMEASMVAAVEIHGGCREMNVPRV